MSISSGGENRSKQTNQLWANIGQKRGEYTAYIVYMI